MSNYKETPDFIEVSLDIIKFFSKELKFDLYVQRSKDRYTKIFKLGDSIDWDRIKTYMSKGISSFFVTSEDFELYSLFVERLGDRFDEGKSFSHEEVGILVRELSVITMHPLVSSGVLDGNSVKKASTVIDACLTSISKDYHALSRILKLLSNQEYLLKHAIAVSMLSILLAQADGMEGETNLKNLGLGAFLHDIGTSQLSFDPEDLEILTAEQRKELWRHPELGKQLLDAIKGIRTEVVQIVLQHHEQPNGHGYPNGLKGAEIFYPAKIVAIADTFAALIAKRSYREAFSARESLAKMHELKGKYDKKLLDTFTKMLIKGKD